MKPVKGTRLVLLFSILLLGIGISAANGISIHSSKIYVGFDEKYVNWLPGKSIGRITTLKVDLNNNNNPKDDPNLYLGDLTGCETGTAVALSLKHAKRWITVNSVLYSAYGEKIKINHYGEKEIGITRNISKLNLKIVENYNVSDTLPICFVDVDVKGLSSEVTRIVYPIWFISHVVVTSDPGGTKYVKSLEFSNTAEIPFTAKGIKNAVGKYNFHVIVPYSHTFWAGGGYRICVEDVNSSWVAMQIDKGGLHYVIGIVALSHADGFIVLKHDNWPHHTMIGIVVYDKNVSKSTPSNLKSKFAIVYARNYSEFSSIAKELLASNVNTFVHIVSVDPSLFPQIKLSVIVNTTDGLEGKLTQDNFKVYEDGVQQKITDFYFTKTAAKGKLDIVVCFDDTGSMWDKIDIMKKKVDELVNNITATGMDVRWALVTFKDYVTVKLPWTTNSTEFEKAVNSLYASGGGDTPEDSLDAIMTALKLGFRPDAEKVVIVITDAPCHYKGDGTGISNYTMPEVASAIKSAGVLFIAVCPYSGAASVMTDNAGNPVATSMLNATDSDLRLLAESVNGIWLDITSADFSKILDKIEKVVTATYIIEYTTTNPALDGTKRMVSVVVNDPVAGYGSDTSWYIAPTTSVTYITTNPEIVSLAPNSTTTLNLILDKVPSTGLSYADITVSITDPSVAEITGIEFPSWASLHTNSALPSSVLTFSEGDLNNLVKAGQTNVTLATLTVKALKPGTTTVTIKVNSFQDDNYKEINSSIITLPATITVMAGPPPIDGHTPKDLNHDGLYEDVNGDGVFNFGDIVFFFYHLPEIMKNPAYVKYLDFNKDGTVNFGDVVALFKMLSKM